jgi:hypothetical protein
MSKLRYGVVYWRGTALKFQSFVRMDQAKVFCEIELREHRDCRMLQYDANKHPMTWVREKMLTALRFDAQGE